MKVKFNDDLTLSTTVFESGSVGVLVEYKGKQIYADNTKNNGGTYIDAINIIKTILIGSLDVETLEDLDREVISICQKLNNISMRLPIIQTW